MSYYNLYWSPTGGTKKVAEAVAQGFDREFTPVDLMEDGVCPHFTGGDVCLVSVPSYGGRVPSAAVSRLEQLFGCGAKAVLIAVFGNRAIDDTLVELSDVLEKSGFRPVAAMEAVAQHSLLPKFGAGRPDEADRQELQEFGGKIRKALEEGTLSPSLTLPGNRPYREYKGVPLHPSVGSGCIGCGLCREACPVGAIPMNCKLTDNSKCISCMRCVAVCPKQVRHLNKFMVFVASKGMQKTCSERKPNRLYL